MGDLLHPAYVIMDNDQVVRLEPLPYAKEDEFRLLVERYPELLGGEQMNPGAPRRWLFVASEMGIADKEDGAARFGLDSLFVDQEGVPTLVEVKRQSDTRLRREVVGQILDYAAHASVFWSARALREAFEKTCAEAKRDPAETLSRFLDEARPDQEEFWGGVARRLQDGDIRLVLLADVIPKEVRRIVQFLNSQTKLTEILAVEVPRYAGKGISMHVPQVFGASVEAQAAKGRRKWDEMAFFKAAEELPEATQQALRKLLAVTVEPGFSKTWGTGTANGSMNVIVTSVCRRSVVSAYTNGKLVLNFNWLPDEVRRRLAEFAVEALELTLEGEWKIQSPAIEAEAWVPKVGDLIAFLRNMATKP